VRVRSPRGEGTHRAAADGRLEKCRRLVRVYPRQCFHADVGLTLRLEVEHLLAVTWRVKENAITGYGVTARLMVRACGQSVRSKGNSSEAACVEARASSAVHACRDGIGPDARDTEWLGAVVRGRLSALGGVAEGSLEAPTWPPARPRAPTESPRMRSTRTMRSAGTPSRGQQASESTAQLDVSSWA